MYIVPVQCLVFVSFTDIGYTLCCWFLLHFLLFRQTYSVLHLIQYFHCFTDYGDDDLLVLLDHFKDTLEHHGVDVAEAELEWTALKKVLHDE